MVVTINLAGGFGNNLKQYIVGCLIAHIKNTNLQINQHYHSICNKDSMNSIYQIIKHDFSKPLPFNLTLISELRNDVSFMYSPFKKSEIFQIRDFINKYYLNWTSYIPSFELTDDDIVISLRLGMKSKELAINSPYLYEYPKGLRIPFSFYENILNQHFNKRIIICCDDFENEFLLQFQKYPNIVLAKENTLIQFQLLKKAKFIISPQSSFSHMAILLSDQQQIGYIFQCFPNNIKILTINEYLNS